MVFLKPVQQERVHLQFCKNLLRVKKSTQNDFIFEELGNVSLQTSVFYTVIYYWLKILETEQTIICLSVCTFYLCFLY